MIKSVTFLKAGYTIHPEANVYRKGKWKKIIFPASVCLIEHDKMGYILFDTGYSQDHAKVTAAFPERLYSLLVPAFIDTSTTAAAQLKKMGIAKEDISYVILSHFHADHIGGVCDFPKAKYIYTECAANQLLESHTRIRNTFHGFLPGLLPSDFIARSEVLLNKNMSLKTDLLSGFSDTWDIFGDESIWGVSLPGHAAGHFGLYFECSGKKRFLIGDAVWIAESLKTGIGPPWYSFFFMHSRSEYQKTLLNLKMFKEDHADVECIPCHCNETLHAIVGTHEC